MAAQGSRGSRARRGPAKKRQNKMQAVSRLVDPPGEDCRPATAEPLPGRGRDAGTEQDALTQTLFAANLVAGTLGADPALPGAAREQAQTLARLVRGALGQARLLALEPQSAQRSQVALAQWLRDAAAALAAQAGRKVHVLADDVDPPNPLGQELFYLARAALTHALHQAGAGDPVHLHWRAGDAAEGHVPSKVGRLAVGATACRVALDVELRWQEQAPEPARMPLQAHADKTAQPLQAGSTNEARE